jgi:hypothetical protein
VICRVRAADGADGPQLQSSEPVSRAVLMLVRPAVDAHLFLFFLSFFFPLFPSHSLPSLFLSFSLPALFLSFSLFLTHTPDPVQNTVISYDTTTLVVRSPLCRPQPFPSLGLTFFSPVHLPPRLRLPGDGRLRPSHPPAKVRAEDQVDAAVLHLGHLAGVSRQSSVVFPADGELI